MGNAYLAQGGHLVNGTGLDTNANGNENLRWQPQSWNTPAGLSEAAPHAVVPPKIRVLYNRPLEDFSGSLAPSLPTHLASASEPFKTSLMSGERQYVDLLFRASKKFASWDPEKPVEVGDWGKITTGRPWWAFWRAKRSVFVKEGNIYGDNIAEECGIPQPTVLGEEMPNGLTWTTSLNAQDMDISVGMEKCVLSFYVCRDDGF